MTSASRSRATIPFLVFFLSGFCGLLYQIVWLRLAFRAFGVITPVLSVVIAVFMLGLAVGAWAGGRWIHSLSERTRVSPAYYYAMAELVIGIGAFAVPALFSLSESYLLTFGEMSSAGYLAVSAMLIGLSILPWSICMGLTFPFMMAFLKGTDRSDTTGFSYLYLANVIGAMCGAAVTAFALIEIFGFEKTLWLAGAINLAIAALGISLDKSCPYPFGADYPEKSREEPNPLRGRSPAGTKPQESPLLLGVILFVTGFATTALEVVWTRAFTPVLTTTVYAFAFLITAYLLATWIGSWFYRRDLRLGRVRSNGTLFALLAVSAFLPVIINDPRVNYGKLPLLFSIMPFSAILGYLTPRIIDQFSDGYPKGAGMAYAVNIIGCILGPLAASYLLLPAIGSKSAMALLALPFLLFFFIYWMPLAGMPAFRAVAGAAAAAALIVSFAVNIGYEDRLGAFDFSKDAVIRRDHTATIISYGKDFNKRLFVNGVGITRLTPITKMMAHWPLSHLKQPPKSALVICFGMGTTFRSLMSWPDLKVTAVELVPSVRDAFGYYFADAGETMKKPNGRVIIDDGRRFLKRTVEKFDVITIDPPPPVQAAGSSFLYSRDFYDIVKMRLNDGGILQQWIPIGGDTLDNKAIIRALTDAFPHVKAYSSVEGWGMHFLASMQPIDSPPVETLLSRLPLRAREDMMEWHANKQPIELMKTMLRFTVDAATLVTEDDVMITDDQPVNEYFILRRILL
ncbi:MAG: hypothetical protein HZB82_09910 [Deltaproteobacteria bacterium]|nr:hypothetical protein [Deltaproteobacteria bacterium]